jgi:hypothetical protein
LEVDAGDFRQPRQTSADTPAMTTIAAEPMWTFWRLAQNRSTLELHEAITRGIGLELEIHDGGGMARTFGVWRLSDTGAIIAMIAAATA